MRAWCPVSHDAHSLTDTRRQLIPGVLMCIMVPFVPETPRYLINHGRSELGLKNLMKLRKLPVEHPYIQTEYQEIEAQVRSEQEVPMPPNLYTPNLTSLYHLTQTLLCYLGATRP